jgi:hypothetical protein
MGFRRPLGGNQSSRHCKDSHPVANPSRGEQAGERGPVKEGYRPGRKTAKRRNWKRGREH